MADISLAWRSLRREVSRSKPFSYLIRGTRRTIRGLSDLLGV